jgi:hypothetical protein
MIFNSLEKLGGRLWEVDYLPKVVAVGRSRVAHLAKVEVADLPKVAAANPNRRIKGKAKAVTPPVKMT